jgi:hypothetical protein
MKKLNEAQLLLLMVLDHQNIICINEPPYPVSTASMKALERRGYAELKNDHFWHITEAGRIEAGKYMALNVPWSAGRGLSAVCDWIERVGWKPELNGGL